MTSSPHQPLSFFQSFALINFLFLKLILATNIFIENHASDLDFKIFYAAGTYILILVLWYLPDNK